MVVSVAGEGDGSAAEFTQLGAVYTATAVAARLGVAVETLRTWDRRYGVGPTGPGGRGAGGRRRYGEGDIGRLLAMRRLVAGGTPTGEAARRALAEPVPAQPAASAETITGAPGVGSPSSVAARRGLLHAASALDVEAVRRTLSGQVRAGGVQRCWDELLVPVLVELGVRWEATGEGVEVEHLLSQVAGTVLRSVVTAAAAQPGQPGAGRGSPVEAPILLAAVDGEQHVLAVDALAALLAEQGYPALTLGASTPAAALSEAVRRIRPAGVFLWARVHRPAVTSAAAQMASWQPARARRPLRIAVGGQGWSRMTLPAAVRRPATLSEAGSVLTDL